MLLNGELIVQNLDHLGIVAGLVDELKIVEQINQHLGEDPRPIFMAICLTAARKFGVVCQSAHFDSTSLLVEGEYLPQSRVTEGVAPVPIRITYGYWRDRSL